MPFTLAHPAAAVPLARLFRERRGILSALVIGSVLPDATHFVPRVGARAVTHSLPGLVGVCLPAGVIVFLLYHHFFKAPLGDLLPAAFRWRLASQMAWRPRRGADVVVAAVGVLLGGLTHVVWDAFTHGDAPGVEAFPVLREQVGVAGDLQLFVYNLLQDGTTLIGFALLVWWIASWYRRAARGRSAPPRLAWERRTALALGMLFVAGLAAVMVAASRWPEPVSLVRLQMFLYRAVIAGAAVVLAEVLVYTALWYGRRARGVREP